MPVAKMALALKQSIAYVFDWASVFPGVVTGTVTAVSYGPAVRWRAPGYFLFALLVLATLEIVSCYWVTSKGSRKSFDWENKVIGKLMILFLVAVAALLDGMFYFGAQQFPADFMPMLRKGFLPITLSSLAWLITAEAARVVHNVSKHRGIEVPGAVLWVIRQMRKEDATRWPGEGLPPRRRIDNLTEDDIHALVERAGADPEDPPPPALKKGSV